MTLSQTMKKPPRSKTPKWLSGRDSNLEARFQAAAVEYIRRVAPQCIVHFVKNGGQGSKTRAKWMGEIAGFPDLLIIDEHGLAYLIEMKPPDGDLNDNQREFRDLCRKRRLPWAQCTTINDVRDQFAAWGIRTREAV
jgi:hypothetical protein